MLTHGADIVYHFEVRNVLSNPIGNLFGREGEPSDVVRPQRERLISGEEELNENCLARLRTYLQVAHSAVANSTYLYDRGHAVSVVHHRKFGVRFQVALVAAVEKSVVEDLDCII